MRHFTHTLQQSKSGKSAILKVKIDDRFGETVVNLSNVRGWRKDLILEHLELDTTEWGVEASRIFIALEVVRSTKTRSRAIKFVSVVKRLSKLEVHFWASKFMNNNNQTAKAWRVLYG